VRTFLLVRDPLDPDEWRIVTGKKGNYTVWTTVQGDFVFNGASYALGEMIADNDRQSIECVMLSANEYEVLMDREDDDGRPKSGRPD
jgi:hypothetical protein